MKDIIIKSPAKINFGLNVIEKRNDGFHNIETVFYPVNLFDEIIFSESDEFIFVTNNEVLAQEENNLIIKAKDKLEEVTGSSFKIKIELKKNIPIGAGLGGGSSNAAAALKGLLHYFNLKPDEGKIQEIALAAGSDIPFFLNPIPSYAEGRGEKLTPISFKIKKPILIINPGIHISTKWAYGNIAPGKSNEKLIDIVQQVNDYSVFKRKVFNSFEPVVFKEYPEIAELKSKLYFMGAEFVLMSGSGSSLFAVFSAFAEAEAVKKKFEEQYFTHISY